MPMLHPCSRCTQALPASAKFCRRCGAAVGEMVTPPMPLEKTTPKSLLSSGFAALVLAALVVGGIFWMNSFSPPAAPVAVPIMPQPSYVTAPTPPVVVVPVRAYPTDPSPTYPEHQRTIGDGRNQHERGR